MTNLHASDHRRYEVEGLCILFGVTKQAYYKRDGNRLLEKLARESFAIEFVKEIRRKDPGIGGKKLWLMYKREFSGEKPVGRDKFADLIDRNGLKLRQRVRKPRTTDSRHGLPVYPNLVKEFIPTVANQLWVSDITYITIWLSETRYIFCYLSMVLDAYSEEIVGWSVGETLEKEYPILALQMALKRLEGVPAGKRDLIHHSDRGCQYASTQYVELLESNGIRISMTEDGNPKDNPQAERINNTMKNELLKDIRFHSLEEVIACVAPAVAFYNQERPHMSLDMLTPAEAAKMTGELRKHWVSYRQMYIKSKRQESPQALPCATVPAGSATPLHA